MAGLEVLLEVSTRSAQYPSEPFCPPERGVLGRVLGESLGVLLGALGALWYPGGVLKSSWEAVGRLSGSSWANLGPPWARLAPSWGWSWAPLGVSSAPGRPSGGPQCQAGPQMGQDSGQEGSQEAHPGAPGPWNLQWARVSSLMPQGPGWDLYVDNMSVASSVISVPNC